MKLTIELDMDNAAFYPMPEIQVRRILRDFLDSGRFLPGTHPLRDSNGNTVGHVTITESD